MKHLSILFLLIFSLAGFSQTGEKVEKNDQKINELNQRLDKLIVGSKSISGDSVNYKLDLLFKEINNLKSEVNSIKQSVNQLHSNAAALNNLDSKLNEMQDGEYYVVVASERSLERANLKLKRLKEAEKYKVVKNAKGTWYHVVLKNAYAMRTAIKTTADLKKNGVKDAWWVTGRKLEI